MNIRHVLLLSSLIIGLPLSAKAQAPSLETVIPFCANGTVIIVDDVRQCRIDDTLDALIADFEQSEILGLSLIHI